MSFEIQAEEVIRIIEKIPHHKIVSIVLGNGLNEEFIFLADVSTLPELQRMGSMIMMAFEESGAVTVRQFLPKEVCQQAQNHLKSSAGANQEMNKDSYSQFCMIYGCGLGFGRFFPMDSQSVEESYAVDQDGNPLPEEENVEFGDIQIFLDKEFSKKVPVVIL